jgi:hypothetical protein
VRLKDLVIRWSLLLDTRGMDKLGELSLSVRESPCLIAVETSHKVNGWERKSGPHQKVRHPTIRAVHSQAIPQSMAGAVPYVEKLEAALQVYGLLDGVVFARPLAQANPGTPSLDPSRPG